MPGPIDEADATALLNAAAASGKLNQYQLAELARQREAMRREAERSVQTGVPFAGIGSPERQPLPVRVGKNLLAAGAGLAGAATQWAKDLPGAVGIEDRAPLDQRDTVQTPDGKWHAGDPRAKAERKVSEEMTKALAAQNAEREALSPWERAHRNVNDLTTGVGQIATDLVAKDRPESPVDIATKSFETGEQMLGPGAQAMANSFVNPKLYPVDAAMNLLPLSGAGRSLSAAGGLKLAGMGGKVGRVGEVMQAVAKPGAVSEGIAALAERAHLLPGTEALAERLDHFVGTGKLTVAEAAEILDHATPFQKFVQYHGVPALSKPVETGMGALKGAASMAVLSGGDPTAAAVGAVGGGISKVFKPAVRSWAKRWFVDPNQQSTPERTARASQILDESQNIRSAITESADEVGHEYGAGRVNWDPNVGVDPNAKAPVPPGYRDVRQVAPTGGLELPPVAGAKRAQLAHLAQGLERAPGVHADLAEMGAMTGPERAQTEALDKAKLRGLKWGVDYEPEWKQVDHKDVPGLLSVDEEAQMRASREQALAAMGKAQRKLDAAKAQMVPDPTIVSEQEREVRRRLQQVNAIDSTLIAHGKAQKKLPNGDPWTVTEPPFKHKAALGDIQRGLDIASGVADPFDKSSVPAKTNNPRVEQAITRIAEIANTGLTGDDAVPRHWFARTMTDVLRENGLSLLYSPRARGAVVQMLADNLNLSGQSVGLFKQQINKAIDEYAANYFGPKENRAKGLTLQMPDGTTKDLGQIVTEAVYRNPKTLAAVPEIQQEAISRVAMQVGGQAADEYMTRELQRELQGFTPPLPSGDLPTTESIVPYVDSLLQHVKAGGHEPLVSPFPGSVIADELRRRGETKLAAVMESQQPAQGAFASFLKEKNLHGVHVDPGFAETMAAPMEARQMAMTAMGLWDAVAELKGKEALRAFTRNAKINMTASNLASWVHNFASNGIVSSLFSGNPVDELSSAYKAVQEQTAFRKNGGTGPDAMMWRALSRAGLGNAGNLDAELGSALGQTRDIRNAVGKAVSGDGSKLAQSISELPDKARRAHGSVEQAARQGYQTTGDMAWKLSFAKRSFGQRMKQLATLGEGEYLGLPLQHGETLRVQRTPSGFEALGKTFNPTSQEFADLVARAAVKDATELFGHGARQPLMVQHARMAGPLSMASPFVTWMWNAIDLPGKPGLLSKTLMHGLNVADTNSTALHLQNAREFSKLAARRSALTSFLTANADPRLDPVRRANAWHASNQAVGVSPDADPDVANVWDWTPADPFAPTELLMTGGRRLAQMFAGAPTYEQAISDDPHEQARVKLWARMESGREFSGEDAHALGLLSGQPLLHLLDPTKPMAKKAAHFAGMLFGVTPTRALELALDPSPLAPGEDDPHRIDAFENAVKVLLDIGTRPVLMTGDKGRAQRQIELIHKGLREALVHPARKEDEEESTAEMADGMDKFVGHRVKSNAAADRAEDAKALIDEVVQQFKESFDKGWDVLHNVKPVGTTPKKLVAPPQGADDGWNLHAAERTEQLIKEAAEKRVQEQEAAETPEK